MGGGRRLGRVRWWSGRWRRDAQCDCGCRWSVRGDGGRCGDRGSWIGRARRASGCGNRCWVRSDGNGQGGEGCAVKIVEDELWSSGKELLFVGVSVVHDRGCIGESVRGYRGCIGGGVVVREDILYPCNVRVGASGTQRSRGAARVRISAAAIGSQFPSDDGGVIASGRSRG